MPVPNLLSSNDVGTPELSVSAQKSWARFFSEVKRLADQARLIEAPLARTGTKPRLTRRAPGNHVRDTAPHHSRVHGTLVRRETTAIRRNVVSRNHDNKEDTQ